MELSGSQLRKLQEILVDSCTNPADLEQFVFFELEVRLDDIAADGGISDQAFQLIKWAKANTRLHELVRAVYARTKHGELRPLLAPEDLGEIPKPPAFYAEPRYTGSHGFVGRHSQLETLNDWAAAANPHPILLFEAIGGQGKSMLTWEWVNHHAPKLPTEWAGRFWYSFYERGAIMADFCRHALAYITGHPLEQFQKRKTPELTELLLRQLQARPWLLVLDGLERVLVAYHRIDAAQVRDEEAGTSDQIANRDPCAAIRPEDDELLRLLTTAAPSKLLLTTRLTPKALLNAAGQPLPGVRQERLPGLRPPEAEELFRACGVSGSPGHMQEYLQRHCDCHPLVTGILAGLVNDYFPDRGNFDAWAADPEAGGRLNLGELDLVQKRNHILRAALEALPEMSRRLLSTLALLSQAVGYETVRAFNPHLPQEPTKPEDPKKGGLRWAILDAEEQEAAKLRHQIAKNDYEDALKPWRQALPSAHRALGETIRDLERRGLLQYDRQTKRYDLHPVVRGTASGRLPAEEKEAYGQRVVDHFNRQSHSPYQEAETLEDVRDGLHLVHVLVQMGRQEEAYDVYYSDLANALLFNLEAHTETLALLRPFFSQGWSILPDGMDERPGAYLANDAAFCLETVGEWAAASAARTTSLRAYLRQDGWSAVLISLQNLAIHFSKQGRWAAQERALNASLVLAELAGHREALFLSRLDRFSQLDKLGRCAEAEAIWQLLDPMGRDWGRAVYRPGYAERSYAWFRFRQGSLDEAMLSRAEQLSRSGKNRSSIRNLHRLRGAWRLEQEEWQAAVESLEEAVRMTREVGRVDAFAEAGLALARLHLGRLPDPRGEAEQLAQARRVDFRVLAELWLAIGDQEQAGEYALKAYEWAWREGEPYVDRNRLNKARALLEQLGAEVPDLPPYDPAKDERHPWEDEVAAAIEELRAEKEAKKREKEAQ